MCVLPKLVAVESLRQQQQQRILGMKAAIPSELVVYFWFNILEDSQTSVQRFSDLIRPEIEKSGIKKYIYFHELYNLLNICII